ncbi:MAG: PHB depolymerase family esterase [Acidobacteriota bacterium]|nr:PHB depolymerase family esterase [Acidobacteriota bacterium]
MQNVSRRRLASAALFVLFLLTDRADARSAQKETLESGGQKRTCWIYRPATLPADATTPLLVLLHGSGRDGSSQTREWQKLADKEGILLAAPNALDPKGWAVPADGPQFLGDVVSFIRSRHPVDLTRIYLFGHSAGAIFALNIGPMESEFFAAVAAHAGAFREASDASILSYASRKIPVFLVVGTKDLFFSLDSVRETKRAFEAKGFRAELLEIPGHDHDYYRRSEEINRKAWEFLSPIHLGREAVFTPYR